MSKDRSSKAVEDLKKVLKEMKDVVENDPDPKRREQTQRWFDAMHAAVQWANKREKN
jgi:hypothetical protein